MTETDAGFNAPTIGDIRAAAARLKGVVNRTPLIESAALNARVGGRVLMKPENLQRMGSFKIRGAYNALAVMAPADRARGVVAWSSGNHAQGVALAARLFDVAAHIVMPSDAPRGKIDAVRGLDAEIVFYDRYSEDRESIARALAAKLQAPLVPSYDDPAVISGQGTVGLEMHDDPALAGEQPDQIIVCCGGGGLCAGISIATAALSPGTLMYAAEPQAADDTARSLAAGKRLANPPDTHSVCDALLTPMPGLLTFPINAAHLRDVLTVSDDEALATVGYARRELRLVLEPGGAVALAALLHGRLDARDKTTVVTLSGGNIADDMLARAVARWDDQG